LANELSKTKQYTVVIIHKALLGFLRKYINWLRYSIRMEKMESDLMKTVRICNAHPKRLWSSGYIFTIKVEKINNKVGIEVTSAQTGVMLSLILPKLGNFQNALFKINRKYQTFWKQAKSWIALCFFRHMK